MHASIDVIGVFRFLRRYPRFLHERNAFFEDGWEENWFCMTIFSMADSVGSRCTFSMPWRELLARPFCCKAHRK